MTIICRYRHGKCGGR